MSCVEFVEGLKRLVQTTPEAASDLPWVKNFDTRRCSLASMRDLAVAEGTYRAIVWDRTMSDLDERDRDVDPRDHDPRDTTLDHLRDEGLIRFVQINGDERAALLTDRGWDVLDAHRHDREDDRDQEFHSGLGRARELQHDTQLFRAYMKVEKRLREEGAQIERIVLERDLRREYQEFLQEHNRNRPDSDGRPDRDAREIEEWAREHDLPYFDESVHLPDFRIEYELDGRDRHEDIEVVTDHYRGVLRVARHPYG